MKSVQRITKVQLKVSPSEELTLIGIVSAEPDYKLSMAINKKLKISLKNSEPLKITDETGNELTFSKFSFHDEHAELNYNLFSNRTGRSCLLKKIKNIDYILQLHHSDKNEEDINRIIGIIRDISSVTAVFNLPLDELKDKNLRYLIL
jgi:hypothetical protein